MTAPDAPPDGVVGAVRCELRELVTALAAALPTPEDGAATWADLAAAHAVRGLLVEALRVVESLQTQPIASIR